MSRDYDRNPPKDAEKPEAGRKDRLGEEDKEGWPQDDADSDGPALINTAADPDIDADPAEEIEEKGEPFDGNHA